jgi:hypothetical protein
VQAYFKALQCRIFLHLSALISLSKKGLGGGGAFVVNVTVSRDVSRRGRLVNWPFEGWGSFKSNILYSQKSSKT